LANAVAALGQLGVVSGTGIDTILTRRLQLGDPGGHVREALKHFPIPKLAAKILERYYVEGGKAPDKPFKSKPMHSFPAHRFATELTVAANFVEVFLAKRGHKGLVGVNLLEKIQLPTLPSLFGAMLAGVDFVLMGAGIPRAIPGALDRLSEFKPASIPLTVADAQAGEAYNLELDPRTFDLEGDVRLERPRFLGIVASAALATSLARKSSGTVQGFVVEAPTAGGHNAPPRGALQLDERGEPIYGPRDDPDFEQIRELGLPFWLAGSVGTAGGLQQAHAVGAAGIQVGTAFAFCEESGLEPKFRRMVLSMEEPSVFTDPLASPTGFPFKVINLPNTLSQAEVYGERARICDLGYLRQAYRTESGQVGFRCSAEPIADFVAKGGNEADTKGRKCLCNALISAVGMGQARKDGTSEPPILTAGNRVSHVREFLEPGATTYTAADVVRKLLGNLPSAG
jgi:nitronate monooxygenase